MNIFGIILFLSVLISPLPGLVVTTIRKYLEQGSTKESQSKVKIKWIPKKLVTPGYGSNGINVLNSARLRYCGVMFILAEWVEHSYGVAAVSKCLRKILGIEIPVSSPDLECSQDESEKHGLNFMLFFSVFLNVSLSLQMCITGSYCNAILIFLEFAILRTIFFVTRSMVSFSLKFKSYLVTKQFFKKYLDLFCNIIRFGFSFFTSTFPVINLVFFLLCAWYRQL